MWWNRGTHKICLLHTELLLAVLKKNACVNFELQAELPTFPNIHDFYLIQQLTDKLRLFKLEYLAYSFLKMREVRLSFKGKQLLVFVASDNIWAFKWKLGLENLYLPPDLDRFQILKNVFDRLVLALVIVNFYCCVYNEIGQHLEDLHNSVNYFQMLQGMKLQIMCG